MVGEGVLCPGTNYEFDCRNRAIVRCGDVQCVRLNSIPA